MIVILCVVLAFMLLPLISVDITTQTRGIIRSQSEAIMLQTAVYGEVRHVNCRENQVVQVNDGFTKPHIMENKTIIVKLRSEAKS